MTAQERFAPHITNDDIMDHEHLLIFQFLDEVSSKAKEDSVLDVVNNGIKLLQDHCDSEELRMIQSNYPLTASHVNDHTMMMLSFTLLRHATDQEKIAFILSDLTKIISQHIENYDKPFAKYITSHSIDDLNPAKV